MISGVVSPLIVNADRSMALNGCEKLTFFPSAPQPIGDHFDFLIHFYVEHDMWKCPIARR